MAILNHNRGSHSSYLAIASHLKGGKGEKKYIHIYIHIYIYTYIYIVFLYLQIERYSLQFHEDTNSNSITISRSSFAWVDLNSSGHDGHLDLEDLSGNSSSFTHALLCLCGLN